MGPEYQKDAEAEFARIQAEEKAKQDKLNKVKEQEDELSM